MMPLCIVVDQSGALVSQGEFTGECTGYVLMTAADYAGSMTIAQLFGWPDPAAFGAAFTTAFGIVLGCSVVAHTVGSIAGFFDTAREEEV
ncbi:hypothetical protein [Pseudomonas citronellolis]|uniref:hypothetical protein n=1 Tax=Pseudomonas citronellolis TaxID=53408 RepID=UPI002D7687A2|nr:hypothetical protein [Pseudomonas citronellolis]WRT81706.1 hypothetical protein VK748_25190 [Pseudomonas citronellolis]WRT81718.1 hypothetical protein VK748_25250 [Pseudomonas citronellolis]